MNFPTHLNCPYCPAQAIPKRALFNSEQLKDGSHIKEYICPAKHTFFC
jgi:hypothetical protein